MNDGKVSTLLVDVDEEINAWSQHDFGGHVYSLVTLPSDTGSDRVYILVDRNNSVCLEQLDPLRSMDCTKSYTPVNKIITVPHLDRLGNLYTVLVDDGISIYEVATKERAGNTLTLDTELDIPLVYVGLRFNKSVKLLPPELQATPFTGLIERLWIGSVSMVLNESCAPYINNELVELRTFEQNLVSPQSKFTGVTTTNIGQWFDTYDMNIEIHSDRAFPLHVQTLIIQADHNRR
jgi:hypothetical protein